MKSVESHHLRALLTSRKVMQRKCIDLENEIRGLLRIFGVVLPLRLSRGAFDVAVCETIKTDPAFSHALLPMLEARAMLFETFTELDRRVKRAAREDTICRGFMEQRRQPDIQMRSAPDRSILRHSTQMAFPTTAPTAAVRPIAKAPQKATRTVGCRMAAPPTLAPRAPSAARKITTCPTRWRQDGWRVPASQ